MPWSMEGKHRWTREDEIAAYALYCITPNNKLNGSNNLVRKVAQIQGISVGSMARKLINIKDLYANDLQQLYGIGQYPPAHAAMLLTKIGVFITNLKITGKA